MLARMSLKLLSSQQRLRKAARGCTHGASGHEEAKAVAVAGQRVVRALAAERLAERVHVYGAHAPHPAKGCITPNGLPRLRVPSLRNPLALRRPHRAQGRHLPWRWPRFAPH